MFESGGQPSGLLRCQFDSEIPAIRAKDKLQAIWASCSNLESIERCF